MKPITVPCELSVSDMYSIIYQPKSNAYRGSRIQYRRGRIQCAQGRFQFLLPPDAPVRVVESGSIHPFTACKCPLQTAALLSMTGSVWDGAWGLKTLMMPA